MKTSRVNHIAVWVLVLYFQLQSMGWYTIFKNPWMKLSGITMEMAENSTAMPYIFAILSTALIVYAIAILFTKLHIYSAKNGIAYGILFNFAFLFLPIITMDMFSKTPFALSMIDAGNYFLFFIITGLVLSLWKRYKKEI
jgi:hypothetical protein